MEFVSKSAEATKKFAKDFVEKLSPKKDAATVVALSGELGAGKTTFVQGVGEALGVAQNMHSPTFVILKRFEMRDSRFNNLVHIDCYRLKNEQELQALGFEALTRERGNLILIEWPERIAAALLPHSVIKLTFEHKEENERVINVCSN